MEIATDVSQVIPLVFAMTKVKRSKFQVFNLVPVDFVNTTELSYFSSCCCDYTYAVTNIGQ